MNGFSIVVCSYNGSRCLPDTLRHLAQLQLPGEETGVEIIVVDNASTDNSAAVAEELKGIFDRHVSFRVLVEPKAGKIHALTTAVRQAVYNWIIICDDDNWLAPDYLLVAQQLTLEFSDVVLFGGMSEAATINDEPLPDWFEPVSAMYAVGQQCAESGYVTYKTNIWGAGSIMQKQALRFALEKQPLLLATDRGEDTEICYRLVMMGCKMYYSHALRFRHFMQAERLSLQAHHSFVEKLAASRTILNKYHHFIKCCILNRRPAVSIVKWNTRYILKEIGLAKSRNLHLEQAMFNRYTPFGKDSDFKAIKAFYKLARKYRHKTQPD